MDAQTEGVVLDVEGIIHRLEDEGLRKSMYGILIHLAGGRRCYLVCAYYYHHI